MPSVMTLVSSRTAPDREHAIAARRHTVILRLLFAASLAACSGGGGTTKDTYTRATDIQGACCENLKGDPRSQCLQQVVRIDDTGAAGSSLNQETFACVVEHFTCDPATGRPTQSSAQAQLECIQQLEGTMASR